MAEEKVTAAAEEAVAEKAAKKAAPKKEAAAKKPAAKKAAVPKAEAEKKAPAKKAAAKAEATAEAQAPAKKRAAKDAAAGTLTIKLVRSLYGRKKDQIATADSLGLHRIGHVTVQPDNVATRGKINKISHLVEVSNA